MNKNNYNPIPLSNIFLNKPFIVGNIQPNDLLKNQVWVAKEMPADTEDVVNYQIGDIILNINPIIDDAKQGFASWICIAKNNVWGKGWAGMERIFILFILFNIVITCKVLAQDTWYKKYELYSLSDLSKNNEGYVMAGNYYAPGPIIFQTNENGDSLNYHSYQFTNNITYQTQKGFAITDDNGCVLSGLGGILKTDENKNVTWNTTLFCEDDTIRGVYADVLNLSDNNILVAGYSTCPTGIANDLFLAKLNLNTGDTIWQHIYNTSTYYVNGTPIYEALDVVAVDTVPDGYIILGNYDTNGLSDGGYPYLVKTNLQGEFMWDKKLPSNVGGHARDISVLPDGNMLVVADAIGPALIKINSNGDVIWHTTYPNIPSDTPMRVININDAYLIVGGHSNSFAMKTDTTGFLIWQQSYDIVTIMYDILAEQNGSFLMLGYNDDDYYSVLIKTDSTGYYQGLGTHSTTTVPISVYPNPAANTLSINHQNLPTAQTVELYNLTGQLVLQQNLQQNNTTISVAGLQVGVYMLQIKAGNTLAQQKVVVWR